MLRLTGILFFWRSRPQTDLKRLTYGSIYLEFRTLLLMLTGRPFFSDCDTETDLFKGSYGYCHLLEFRYSGAFCLDLKEDHSFRKVAQGLNYSQNFMYGSKYLKFGTQMGFGK